MKKFVRALTGWVCLALCGAAACQTSYPSRAVSLMVPYPAGSASDFTARALQESLGKELGGPVIVENIGGASGAIAATKVLAAPADGYYVFQGSPNELILSGLVNKSVKYRPEDFRMAAPVAISSLVLVTSSRVPVNTMDELVDLARSSAKTPLTYGSPGPGSLYHLLGELLSKKTGVPLTHVAYKGGAPMLQDLIGGQIDFAFMPYQASYADLAKQGRIKVIGALSGTKLPAPFEAVQSYADTRQLKDFKFSIWTAYMVKTGTPQPLADRIGQAIQATLKSPTVRSQLEAQAKTLFPAMSLEQAAKFYATETAQYRELVKTIGFEAQ